MNFVLKITCVEYKQEYYGKAHIDGNEGVFKYRNLWANWTQLKNFSILSVNETGFLLFQ